MIYIISVPTKSYYAVPSLKKPLQVSSAMHALLTLSGYLVFLKYVVQLYNFFN